MVLEPFNRNIITIPKIFVYCFFLYSQVSRNLDIGTVDSLIFDNFQEISNIIFLTGIITASNIQSTKLLLYNILYDIFVEFLFQIQLLHIFLQY